MSNFDYTQYGSDTLSEEQRESFLILSEEYHRNTGQSIMEVARRHWVHLRDAHCTALREIDHHRETLKDLREFLEESEAVIAMDFEGFGRWHRTFVRVMGREPQRIPPKPFESRVKL